MSKPDWDLLICASDEDAAAHHWFPAGKTKLVNEFTALEGIRFRNVYLTSRAIEKGSWVLFQILYRTAKIMQGKVLHVSDYQE